MTLIVSGNADVCLKHMGVRSIEIILFVSTIFTEIAQSLVFVVQVCSLSFSLAPLFRETVGKCNSRRYQGYNITEQWQTSPADHNLKDSGGVFHILPTVSSKFPLQAAVLGFHNLNSRHSSIKREGYWKLQIRTETKPFVCQCHQLWCPLVSNHRLVFCVLSYVSSQVFLLNCECHGK